MSSKPSKPTAAGGSTDLSKLSPEARDALQHEALSNDGDRSAVAAVLRENAALSRTVKDQRARIGRMLTLCVIEALTLLVFFGAWIFFFPKYRYIPTKDNQAICQVNSQISPDIMEPDVRDFARDAVLHAYSYDYVNYRKTLNEVAGRWFTDDGQKAFWRSLDTSGNLDKVIKGRLILRSTLMNDPQVQREGRDEQLRDWWEVVVPIWISFYQNGEEQPASRQPFNAIVRVVQVPASQSNKKGILVNVINLSSFLGGSGQ
jgi:intracellular multiplication protein IcmL